MKSTKNILTIIIMILVMVTAILLLLTVFNITGGEETRKAIIKITEACGIIALASAILLVLSNGSNK
jgi:hypothetical protein